MLQNFLEIYQITITPTIMLNKIFLTYYASLQDVIPHDKITYSFNMLYYWLLDIIHKQHIQTTYSHSQDVNTT